MDINALKAKVMEFLKKYRFVILILCIGILLMILPTGKAKEQAPQLSTSQPAIQFDDPTNALTDILSQIQGAGKVRLMLTKGAGERTVYQTNEDRNIGEQNQSVRVETVIVTDKDRAQHGLVQQVLAPEYRGAIVVCQGADDASVRLAIIEAVADATGLGTDRISVLKMK
jgi:stage III sporulation protein AG